VASVANPRRSTGILRLSGIKEKMRNGFAKFVQEYKEECGIRTKICSILSTLDE